MKNQFPLSPAAPMLQITLESGQPVMPLLCRAGQRASLEVLSGRLWLTQQGRSNDWFLEAGQCLAVQGPAVLYASADGAAPLRLRWLQEEECALPARSAPPARLSAA